jgi:hypothetical protein
LGRLLRGQAGRKQAEELARKSSNQKWQNALLGVRGNDCPGGRPVVFSVGRQSFQDFPGSTIKCKQFKIK